MNTYIKTQKLYQATLSLKKEHTAFVYSLLEALEGPCMYSTLPYTPGDPLRSLQIIAPIEFKNPLIIFFQDLKKQFFLDIQSESEYIDGSESELLQ